MTLFCNVTGKPVPSIRWTKKVAAVDDDEEEDEQLDTPVDAHRLPLSAHPATRTHYTCHAENVAGKVQSTFELNRVEHNVSHSHEHSSETPTSTRVVSKHSTIQLECGLTDVNDAYGDMKWLEHANGGGDSSGHHHDDHHVDDNHDDHHPLFGVVVDRQRLVNGSRVTIRENYKLTNVTENLTVICGVDALIVHMFKIHVIAGTH